jgi:pimeloyl-ACP methyl ester carboxylesterase
MRRHEFLAGAAALGLAGCGSSSGTSGTGQLPPTGIGQGHLSDLRWTFAPVPPTVDGIDPAGDAKALILPTSASPAQTPIPGYQIVGSYAAGERYVLRIPDAWNGKLVVVGTPAFRSEYANDGIWSDFLLSLGYAYACSNKGVPYNAIVETIAASPNPNLNFPIDFDLAGLETAKLSFRFGVLYPQKRPIAGWNDDFAQLTQTAQAYLGAKFKRPAKTYAVGLSNGGAEVRSLLERHPDLVDGGVDWSGVFWSPNLSILDYLPKFVAAMPPYVASGFTDANARAAIVAAGYPDDVKMSSSAHPSLWFEYYAGQASFYADLTIFSYALLIDPQATATLTASSAFTPNPANPAQLPGSSATAGGLAQPAARGAYVPSAAARSAIASFAHSGNIGKPLISIAGASDMFITPRNNATPYLDAVKANGKGSMYWQYLVTGGTHVDTFAAFGYGLQPQLPFAWAAFNELVNVVEHGAAPAGAGTQQTVSSPAQIAARARATS